MNTRFYSKNGITVSTRGTMIVDRGFFAEQGKKGSVIASDESVDRDVAIWGANNLLPQELWADIENTGVLWSGIEAKARIAVGKGPMLAKLAGVDKNGGEILEFVSNPEISEWMEMSNFFEDSYALCKDLLAVGNAFDQLLLSPDRKRIIGFKRQDAADCRFSAQNARGVSDSVFISSDWSKYGKTSKDGIASDKHMAELPLLNIQFPYYDLVQRTKENTFMMCYQYPLFARKYYALPLWYAARTWVKMAQGIPELKKAMVNNQMTLNYLVEIHPQFWNVYDPKYDAAGLDQKKKIQDEFYTKVEEYLVGGKNAYKSLFATQIPSHEGNPQPGIKITQVEGKGIPEGKMLVDSAAANSEILFALMINPALIGADTPGGPYSGGAGSGSNIREALLSQVILMEVERKIISRRFNLAKQFNGWDKDLVLRFPNQLLTTLNEGANTKPTS